MISEVAGQPVRTVSDLLSRIAALVPGQPVAFTLLRRGETSQATVTPVQRPRPRAQPQR